MAKAKEKEPGFEESLDTLEKIVAQLESGDLPLERALEIFEAGVGLARRCQAQLEEAERKVEVLLRERGEIKTIPFELRNETYLSDGDKLGGFVVPSSTQTSRALPLEASDDDANSDDIIPF
ncbi:MAG: exodeoxyribonuclease VII small subunit [Acidobacteria bacterium]|nr:exodeoxyribonuclease VII small subunit [Acidobacteriota bacterium]MBI3422631.1 exodeoxyribonuclease VII small subunit [Acidobacteriota bacterium]